MTDYKELYYELQKKYNILYEEKEILQYKFKSVPMWIVNFFDWLRRY